MKIRVPRLICTGKPEPHSWERDGRSGTIYRAEMSDGTGNITYMCKDAAVYSAIAPFQPFEVELTIEQYRSGDIRLTITDVAPAK